MSYPIPGLIYRHYKGNNYEVVNLAIDEETGREVVVYRETFGRGVVWCRTVVSWTMPAARGEPAVADLERYALILPEKDVEIKIKGSVLREQSSGPGE